MNLMFKNLMLKIVFHNIIHLCYSLQVKFLTDYKHIPHFKIYPGTILSHQMKLFYFYLFLFIYLNIIVLLVFFWEFIFV